MAEINEKVFFHAVNLSTKAHTSDGEIDEAKKKKIIAQSELIGEIYKNMVS